MQPSSRATSPPTPDDDRPRTATRVSPAGFTLVELLVVTTIIGLLLALAANGLRTSQQATGLTGAARQLTDALGLARSESIARNTVVRVSLTTHAPGTDPDTESASAVALWAWDHQTESFQPISTWEPLPAGTTLLETIPDVIRAAPFAAERPALVRGADLMTDPAALATFPVPGGGEALYPHVEFLPDGRARIQGVADRRILLALATATAAAPDDGFIGSNWAHLVIDRHTGRTSIHRP